MKETSRKIFAGLLAFVMLLGMVNVPVFATETDAETPVVTVDLIPGETTDGSATIYLADGTVIRKVYATTSEIETVINDSYGEMTAPQPALKFDRNDTTDQAAQKVARELYTDNGHFADPSTITVTDAPAGYPFKYVGFGDYSGHYISHVRVVYKRDEAGKAIKDANGNYVIDHLEHAGSGTPLYYGNELTTNIDGPYHYATGTRPQQFLLMDENGQTFYGYCIDLDTGADSGTWYTMANLEDNNYYASWAAENHVRGIVFNGYWGTESGTGSLASLKAALKAAVASGSVEDDYNIKMVNRKKFTTGYELKEGEYHYGSYVYWDIPAVDVTLTSDIIDGLTEGEALDAMQAAIWSWANGSQATLNGVDGVIVGDLSAASSAMSDSLNGKNDAKGAARTRALYAYLMQQTASADSVIINDKTFAEEMSLTLGEEVSANMYAAALHFNAEFPVGEADELSIKLTYVDANGSLQTIEKPLTGEGALVADANDFYTIDGLTLKADQDFQFSLNIFGQQYLEKNAYIFTSEGGTYASQTMVSMAEGWHNVDVTKSVNSSFTVNESFIPYQPTPPEVKPETPTADKTSELIDRDEDRFEIEIRVPGVDGVEFHDEVIMMVDGSYSGDEEWPAMMDVINAVGEAVLNGNGNTQLTLMAFGMGDNIVLKHVTDADALAATLGSLPGSLLYGRSSTNNEVGFTGVENYIKNHNNSLNKVHVIYISDGRANTDETPRKFYDWQTFATKFGALTVAQVAFEETVLHGANLPEAFRIFGDRFDGMSREDLLNHAFGGGVSDEEFIAFANQVYKDVYAYSGLYVGVAYPVSVVERAFVKYDKENGTYLQDAFYYATYKSAYVTYPNCVSRAIEAAEQLAAMDNVEAMYLIDTDSATEWMSTGVTNAKVEFIQCNGVANMLPAIENALTNLSKTPFNDVVITDYMSKWVNLDQSTLKIIDNSTGEAIWTATEGWLIDENRPTAQEVPVIVELVDPADYAAGGDDVIGNTSGDIYKLTWYVKDGAMLRSDTYSLKYEVIVDAAEAGSEPNVDYPSNGDTDLHYKDENGEDQETPIDVPDVDYVVVETLGSITVTKVTQGDAATPETAMFQLQKLEGEDWINVGEAVPYSAFVDGKYTFSDLTEGTYRVIESGAEVDDHRLAIEYVYEDSEADYVVLTKTVYPNLDTSVSSGSIEVINTYTAYVHTLGSITVTKISTGAATPATATFQLQMLDGEEWVNVGEAVPYSAFVDGKYTFSDLTEGTYRVIEDGAEVEEFHLATVDGEIVTLTKTTMENGDTFVSEADTTVTNDYTPYIHELGSITVIKISTGADTPATATFQLQKQDGENWINVGEAVPYSAFVDGKYTFSGLTEGTYRVIESGAWVEDYRRTTVYGENVTLIKTTEDDGDTFVSNDSIEVTNTYTPYVHTLGSITVTKTSTGAATPATATFQLQKLDGENWINVGEAVPYSAFVDGKYTFSDLTEGTYRVIESGAEVDGFILTTTNSGNVVLTKSYNDGDTSVNNGEIALVNEYEEEIIEIPDDDVPEGPAPTDPTDPTEDEEDDETIEIPEDDVPLADVPNTGDQILPFLIIAIASGAAAIFVGKFGKKEEEI